MIGIPTCKLFLIALIDLLIYNKKKINLTITIPYFIEVGEVSNQIIKNVIELTS